MRKKRNRKPMPVNTEDLKGQFVLCQWKHDKGYQQNWLRRITRQTKTQYICDVQHTLLLSAKYKKLYDSKKSDYLYGLFQRCAFRLRMVKGKLVSQVTNLSNPDGFNHITLLSDIKTNHSALLCPLKYEELFDIDIRTVLPLDSHTLEGFNRKRKFAEERNAERKAEGKPIMYDDVDAVYKISTCKAENGFMDCHKSIIEHLTELFNVPIYELNDYFAKVDTTHDTTIYSKTAIHYHINHYGNDKPVISFKENQNNDTIAFWLFADKVVYKRVEGIDSW
jgi:hypothetical protein